MTIKSPYTLPALQFVGGATQNLLFNCYSCDSKEAADLTDCTAELAIISFQDPYGDPLLSKTMTVADNTVTAKLLPDETVELEGKYIYQITMKNSEGFVGIPNQGIMRIINNIDKPYIQG